MAKPRFGLEDHQAAGKEIGDIYGRLIKLNVRILNAYPSAGEESKAARGAAEAVKHLMLKMDETVCRENPDAPDAEVTGCYLGPSDPPADSK